MNFLKDVLVLMLPTLLAFGYPVFYLALVYYGLVELQPGALIGGWFASVGIGVILATVYKYPGKLPEDATVIDLMSDIYASPVRGRAINLKGKLIGRGVPGLIFSEDMVLQDKTGLMFLNYESWLPVIGNLLFGLTKVGRLLNREANISGWFLRGISPVVGLRTLETDGERISGFVKLGGIIGGALLIAAGLVFIYVLF